MIIWVCDMRYKCRWLTSVRKLSGLRRIGEFFHSLPKPQSSKMPSIRVPSNWTGIANDLPILVLVRYLRLSVTREHSHPNLMLRATERVDGYWMMWCIDITVEESRPSRGSGLAMQCGCVPRHRICPRTRSSRVKTSIFTANWVKIYFTKTILGQITVSQEFSLFSRCHPLFQSVYFLVSARDDIRYRFNYQRSWAEGEPNNL